jgi:hypothetical protein
MTMFHPTNNEENSSSNLIGPSFDQSEPTNGFSLLVEQNIGVMDLK